MIRRPPRSTQSRSSAASDVYKRQVIRDVLIQGFDEFPAFIIPVEGQEGEPHHVRGTRTQRGGHEDLTLPFWIREVLPAFRHLVARLGQAVLVGDQDKREVGDVVPV